MLDNSDEFGIDVGGLGDLDGDGIEDIVVGAHQDDDGTSNFGAVYVLFLNSNGTVKAEQKISDTAGGLAATLDNNDAFGSSVGGVGDIDVDGVADLVVGAPHDGDGASLAGAAYVLFLNADGTVKGEQKISNLEGDLGVTLDGSDQFGYGVAGIGDLDEDGTIKDARIALASVAPTPIRSLAAETALVGQRPTKQTFEAAAEAAVGDASPISDTRATADYRRELVRALTRRTLAASATSLGSEQQP